MSLLDLLLARHTDRFDGLDDFRVATRSAAGPFPSPVDRALVGGAVADRLGYAFAAGYDAALHALVPDLAADTAACLCVTEAGGVHPRAIGTRLRDGRVTGRKTFVTLAGDADVLFVAASAGGDAERNDVRLVRVARASPGVHLAPLPPTRFTPEIAHYAVELDEAPVDAVLPGDGWARWVKPFRTVEDAHVAAASTAWLLRVARASGWPPAITARLVALALALRETALLPADAPSTHVALAGGFAALDAVVAAAEPCWADTDPGVAASWRRDVPLLSVASQARAARLEAAWRALG